MAGKSTHRLAALALILGLVAPAGACADTLLGPDGHLPPDCRGSYPAAHYRFPLLWRLYACYHYPSSWEVYPSDRFPLPPRYYAYRARCPYEYPAKLYDYPSLAPAVAPAAAQAAPVSSSATPSTEAAPAAAPEAR